MRSWQVTPTSLEYGHPKLANGAECMHISAYRDWPSSDNECNRSYPYWSIHFNVYVGMTAFFHTNRTYSRIFALTPTLPKLDSFVGCGDVDR